MLTASDLRGEFGFGANPVNSMTDANPSGPNGASPRRTKSQIPRWLQKVPRWITWQRKTNAQGQKTRRPAGSTRNPDNWHAFQELGDFELTNERGLGLVFTGGIRGPGGTLLALDMDACMEAGAPVPWAREVIDGLDNPYTEVSPSGTGLRAFLLVKDPPKAMPVIDVPADAPDGVHKNPEIQTFGCGPAGYVTVTGNQLPGTSPTPARLDSLKWLQKRFGAQLKQQKDVGELPAGDGVAPTMVEIEEALGSKGQIADLRDGRWDLHGYPSASEGYRDLAYSVLVAARRHVREAALFLITETAYGRGEVESKEPEKYARAEWVVRDLKRIAGQLPTSASSVFADVPDPDTWEPPEGHKPQRKEGTPWFEHVSDFMVPKTLPWLLEGFLPAHGLAQFFGAPGCGKSAVLVSLSVAVACGLDWNGHRCRRPGWVYYIAGEGRTGLRNRFFAAFKEWAPDVPPERGRVYVSNTAGQFLDPKNRGEWVRQIARLTEKHGELPSMIVLDTQITNFGGGDESSTEDMTNFMAGLQEISDETKALIVTVHHTGHRNLDRARGNSVQVGALDAILEVSKKPQTKSVVISSKKAKDWDDPEPIFGELAGIEVGLDEEGKPFTAVIFRGTGGPEIDPSEGNDEGLRALLDYLRENGPAKMGRRKLALEIGLSERSLREIIEDGEALGLLRVDGSTNQTTYSLTGG